MHKIKNRRKVTGCPVTYVTISNCLWHNNLTKIFLCRCLTLKKVLHIENYPLHYDACYFPEIQLENFLNFDSVRDWILKGLKIHFSFCDSCIPFSDDSVYEIEELSDGLKIHFAYENMKLPKNEMSSSNFTFCRLITQLMKIRLRENERCLQKNPLWLFRQENYYKTHLDVPKSDLDQLVVVLVWRRHQH